MSPVSGVIVTVTPSTGPTVSAVTDNDGHFAIPNFGDGEYTIALAPPAGFASDPALITFGDQEVTDGSGPRSGSGIAGLATAQSTWQATILPASSTFLNTIATAWNAYLASDAVAWAALQLTAAGIPPDQQSNFEAAWNQFKSDLAASANAFNAQAATALNVLQAGQPAGLASLIPSIPFAPLSTFSTLGTQAAAQGYIPAHLPTGISDNSNPIFQYYYGQSGLLINAVFPGFGITLAAPAQTSAPNSPPFLSPVGPPVNNAIPFHSSFRGWARPRSGLISDNRRIRSVKQRDFTTPRRGCRFTT